MSASQPPLIPSTEFVPDAPSQPSPERGRPINFAICVVDAFSWSFGMALWSLTTIIPLFLLQLGASNFVIGLAPAIISLGYSLPGMLVARRISRLRVAKWWLFVVAIFERIPLLTVAILIPIIGPEHPQTLLLVFLGCITAHAIFLGFNQPAFWAVVAKVIPMRQRGRMFGIAGVVSGLAGFLIDPLTRHLLSAQGIASLRGFSQCFLIGTIILTVGILPFAAFAEPLHEPTEATDSDVHAGQFWPAALAVWRSNAPLRRMIRGQCLISLAAMAQPFFVLEYGRRFHVAPGAVADFTTIGVVLGAFASLGWGVWGDHRGNKGVLIVSQLLAVVASATALALPPAGAFYLVFAASALSSSGIGIASYNIVMEFAGEAKQTPFYTSLFNAAIAPFRTIAPLIGGLVADHAGYGWVFGLSAACSAAALVLTMKMEEPRSAAKSLA